MTPARRFFQVFIIPKNLSRPELSKPLGRKRERRSRLSLIGGVGRTALRGTLASTATSRASTWPQRPPDRQPAGEFWSGDRSISCGRRGRDRLSGPDDRPATDPRLRLAYGTRIERISLPCTLIKEIIALASKIGEGRLDRNAMVRPGNDGSGACMRPHGRGTDYHRVPHPHRGKQHRCRPRRRILVHCACPEQNRADHDRRNGHRIPHTRTATSLCLHRHCFRPRRRAMVWHRQSPSTTTGEFSEFPLPLGWALPWSAPPTV
jgi:hypothetical protein